MKTVIPSASGIVAKAISASSGEIQNISPNTPAIVSAEVISWLSPC